MPTTYKLIQGDSVLVVQPLLIQHYGRVGASLIQQIYYWSQKGQGVIHDNQRWIHNTAEQWAEQLCVSARTIKRTVHKLIEDGAIRVQKLAKHKSNQTNSYTLNHARLQQIMEQAVQGKNGANPHGDILSPSSGHDVPMVIQRLTNKNKNNKSEDCVAQHIQTLVKVEGKSDGDSSSMLNELNQVQGIAMPPKAACNDSSGAEKTKAVRATTAQDMVDIWNSEVSTNKESNKTKLNRAISKYLVASFKYKFNEDLYTWRQYCRLIASSPYLMGKGFNLSLTWALKFATIDRILAGELGVQLRCSGEQPRTEQELHGQALAHVEGVGESDGCKSVRHDILRAVGACQYNAWFTKVDVLDDGKILRPHNRFVEAAIQARFGDVLERVVG